MPAWLPWLGRTPQAAPTAGITAHSAADGEAQDHSLFGGLLFAPKMAPESPSPHGGRAERGACALKPFHKGTDAIREGTTSKPCAHGGRAAAVTFGGRVRRNHSTLEHSAAQHGSVAKKLILGDDLPMSSAIPFSSLDALCVQLSMPSLSQSLPGPTLPSSAPPWHSALIQPLGISCLREFPGPSQLEPQV